MGVDTRATLKSITDIEDLKKIMEGYLDLEKEIKVRPGYDVSCMLVTFEFRLTDTELYSTGGPRSMFVHFRGGQLEISLGAGEKAWAEEAHHIMKTILMVTGGYFTEYDTSDREERIIGLLEPSDGLMFHVRNSIMNGALVLERPHDSSQYCVKCNDVEGLARTIGEWKEKYD